MARSGWALRVVVMAAAAAVACAGVVACGSEGGAAVEGEGAAQAREGAAAGGMQKIRPGSRVYVLDDLTAVGFK
ncbi:MAG: hypothetical protein FJ313_08745, partial [Gemmatimonadetes bacterium]|nr:hypothetical protein [Gemmatimonadota bacterium]